MKGRYCEMCDQWWAHRITKECPACGADTVKGEIPEDEPKSLMGRTRRRPPQEEP